VPNARRGPCGATKCATLNDVNQLLLLILDLTGTFAFALNGALTAIRLAKLDVVGVLTLGIVTAIGGGILRDVVIGATPPPGFADWRYLAVAGAGALIAFLFGYKMSRLSVPINILDAAGLSLFAVTGASKALALGLGPVPAAQAAAPCPTGTSSPAATGPGGVPSPKGRPPNASRPCGVSQPDVSGPSGTIPVGLMSRCTM
jgi:hypothetical protein